VQAVANDTHRARCKTSAPPASIEKIGLFAIHSLPAYYSLNHASIPNLPRRHIQRIAIEHKEIRQLTRLDRAFALLFEILSGGVAGDRTQGIERADPLAGS
jgi:hypothetical protein